MTLIPDFERAYNAARSSADQHARTVASILTTPLAGLVDDTTLLTAARKVAWKARADRLEASALGREWDAHRAATQAGVS